MSENKETGTGYQVLLSYQNFQKDKFFSQGFNEQVWMNKKVSHGLNRESLLRQLIKFCPVVGISNCRKLFEGLNQNDLAEKCGSHSFSRHDSSSENTQISLGEHTENTQRTQVPRRAIAIFSSCNSWSSRCNFLRFAVSLLSTFGIWIWIC